MLMTTKPNGIPFPPPQKARANRENQMRAPMIRSWLGINMLRWSVLVVVVVLLSGSYGQSQQQDAGGGGFEGLAGVERASTITPESTRTTITGMTTDIGVDGETRHMMYQPEQEQQQQQQPVLPYGVDVSFPIHHLNISTNYAYLPHNVDPVLFPIPDQYLHMPVSPFGEDRLKLYEEYIEGCVRGASEREDSSGSTHQPPRCLIHEQERIEMALLQPRSMRNYTALGFHKIRAPEPIFRLLQAYWDRGQDLITDELWPRFDTYTNHWAAPPKVLSLDRLRVSSTGKLLKLELCDEIEGILSGWVGQKLKRANVYGIRIYTRGAVLATHVDRFPLVISAIINVAQDVDEPWPLEVIGHDGYAYNVTMEPGDMVLYESHSLLHGRPFPLKGRYMANVFVHFEPIGPLLDPENNTSTNHDDTDPVFSIEHGLGNLTKGLPIYIVPGSPAEDMLLKIRKLQEEKGSKGEDATEDEEDVENAHVLKMKKMDEGDDEDPPDYEEDEGTDDEEDDNVDELASEGRTVVTAAHEAAAEGKTIDLAAEIEQDPGIVNALDDNGWTPLHVGILGGHFDVVQLLIEHGANKDARTDFGTGGSALWWAKQVYGHDHSLVELLESIGAVDVGPDF